MRKQIFETNQLVAVYGTLKRGFGNHRLLSNATFLGSGTTKDKYRLCVSGLPYMLKGVSEEGHNVEVEVYDCNPFEMYNLDLLEGHPRFYKREKVDVVVGEKTMSAWVYFVPDSIHYNNGTYVDSYRGANYNEVLEQIETQY